MKKDAKHLNRRAKQLVYMTHFMTGDFLKHYFIFSHRTSEITINLLSRSF